jgi:predicted transcriptional regulator of viral defense system
MKMSKQRALMTIARYQGGYFTARQALAAGYTYQEQRHHTLRGNWEKIERRIYRIPEFPELPYPQRDDLVVLTLISHDRYGEPQAVASHETALAIHEISDANPARIHLTVPPSFRRYMPPGIVLYKARLSPQDWEEREGYRVTTPLRTILDAAASPSTWSFLPDAIYDALQRGLVRSRQIAEAAAELERREAGKWLRDALEMAQQRTSVREW